MTDTKQEKNVLVKSQGATVIEVKEKNEVQKEEQEVNIDNGFSL